jgi:hypothetical protein
VSDWTPDDLATFGRATEIGVAWRRLDGSLRPYVTIWAVRVGDDIYIRSAHGPNNGWYRRATASGTGRIRAGAIEHDVSFVEADAGVAADVSAAYRAKYDRYGPAIVGTVVSPAAEQLTLRLTPR